jgi:hydrophobe/amphiphile efflux-3 (HAE3) family protein
VSRIFGFFANISEKRPWLVVIIVAAITIFMAAGFPRVSTELSQEAMMPKHYESVQALDEVNEKFGGLSVERVLLTAEDVTDPEIARMLLALDVEKIQEDGFEEGHILKAETYLDFLKQMFEQAGRDIPTDDNALAMVLDFYMNPDPDSPFVDVIAGEMPPEQTEQLIPGLVDNRERIEGSIRLAEEQEDSDLDATLISFQLSPDLDQNEEADLARQLEDYVDEEFGAIEGVEVYVAGFASMQKDSQEFMQRETSKLMLAALLFIMLILYLTFRRLSDIGLPLLVIFTAIAWLVGLMGWAGITYTTMSVAIMPLMLGINIAYVIHILSRYYEERESGEGVDLSATTSVKTVGVAVFLTAITTMIGFSSFMITDMPPMRDFGLLCVLGIAFSFLLSVTLLPAITIIRDRRKKDEKLEAHLEKMRVKRRDSIYGKLIDGSLVRMALVSERHHWTVALVTLILAGFAVFAMFNVKTGADVRKMMPEDMPSREASEMITDIFGPQESDVILVEGDIYEPENLAAILAMEDALENDERNYPDSDDYFARERIQSIADIVKDRNDGELPESREEVEEIVGDLSTLMPVSAFITEDGTSAMVMVTSGFPETEDEFKVKANIMRDQSDAVEESTEMTLNSTGTSFLVADLLGNILPTQLKTSALALLLCALVLIIVFRSLFYGLATLIVVVCGIIVELIFLLALGWPLDLMTVMVSSLVIGAGIDFGIHITHRFREEWHHGDTPLDESIKNTVLHVGRALVAAAFTTCGVFAILGISSMVPLQRFGFTTAVALLGALFGAVLVLPSLLAIIANREKRKGKALPEAAPEPELLIEE